MEDFADARELLEGVGAGITVRSADELSEKCLDLLDHPDERESRGRAGREALWANQGAARRNAELAIQLLENR
jgi:3-deoxy-D-manno-octulosonic-acid transferase